MNPSDRVRQVGVVQAWLAQTCVYGQLINPTAADEVCTTGGLAAGYYDIFAHLSIRVITTDASAYMAWCNSAETTLVMDKVFCMAGTAQNAMFTYHGIKLDAYDYFRVAVGVTFTGVVLASIVAVRRA